MPNRWNRIFGIGHQAFPGSRFVLMVRDKDRWLKSIERQWKTMDRSLVDGSATQRFIYFIQLATYGVYQFCLGRLSYVYDRHEAEVRRYFANRCDDLLIMDVTASDGYEKLCPFLGMPTIDEPFPRSNSATSREDWLGRWNRVHAALQDIVPTGERLALVALDNEIESGTRFIAFTWPAFWWLDYYPRMVDVLKTRHRLLLHNEDVAVYQLNTNTNGRRRPKEMHRVETI